MGLGYLTYTVLTDLFISVKNIQSYQYRENPLEIFLLFLISIPLCYILVKETDNLQEDWTKKIKRKRHRNVE